MNALAVPFRQLVERRLWPLALLLLAALAAVPLLLATSGDEAAPVAPAADAAALAKAAAATTPIVSVTDATARDNRRRVLGTRKDPFRPAVRGKAPTATGGTTAPTAKPAGAAGAGGGGAGGATGGATLPGGIPTTALPTAPKKTYELYSLTVRFGTSDLESLESQNLKRLTALPSVEEPVVIYLGLLKNLRTAVFLVDSSATPQGDGRCVPRPSNCQTIQLDPGETSFFDVTAEDGATVVQYQLDYVKVKRKKTTNARAARASRLGDAAGRRALRARTSRLGAWRYDARSGTLKRLNRRELKAEASARAARAR